MLIVGDRYITIKPIKMKYLKDNFFGYCDVILKNRLNNLLKYKDGEDILNIFLNQLFDYDNDLISYVRFNITDIILFKLIEESKKINEYNIDFNTIEDELVENKNNIRKTSKNSNNEGNSSLTIRRYYAILGVYCGLSERELDECTYLYFKDCINELGYKLNYEKQSKILGNSRYDVMEIENVVNKYHPFIFNPIEDNKPRKLTIKDIEKTGIKINKLQKDSNIKLIKDMKLDKEET